jgi:hypothetical protein
MSFWITLVVTYGLLVSFRTTDSAIMPEPSSSTCFLLSIIYTQIDGYIEMVIEVAVCDIYCKIS